MIRTSLFLAVLIVALASAGCAKQPPPAELKVALDEIGQGFNSPVYATHDGTGSDRIYVVEQPGRVMILEPGRTTGTVFLDIRSLVGSGGERGLLGLAFKDYEKTRNVYVHYTDKEGDTVLARFKADEGGARADPGSQTVLLTQAQPFSNHNGGMIEFGRDGFLYFGLGDGGSSGDPEGNGQKLTTLLGKILRLDVSGASAECPSSNPDLGTDARCEIWSYGLRNPWRLSFDRGSGDLFIGDVGQNQWEEINHRPASSGGGENYGWNVYEGTHRYRSGSVDDHIAPIFEYATGPDGTCAVTGGYVYRGDAIPPLKARYVFGDYCNGKIWMLEPDGNKWTRFLLLETDARLSSFGEDADGEILVIGHGGSVYRLVSG